MRRNPASEVRKRIQFLIEFGKTAGYKSESTMRRSLGPWFKYIEAENLGKYLVIVSIEGGRNAGRLVPALVVPNSEMPDSAFMMAQAGFIVVGV